METINVDFAWEEIVQAMVKDLRADVSQEKFSKSLGYGHNQCYKWEKGIKKIMWQDFVQICQWKKIPLANILHYHYEIPTRKKGYSSKVILKFFVENYFHHNWTEMARYLKISCQNLNRYYQEKNKAPCEKIFQLLAFRPQIFLSVLKNLGVLERIPALDLVFRQIKNKMAIDSICPYVSAVQHLINSARYQQKEGLSLEEMAQDLHLTINQVQQAINHSLAAGVITIKENGKYYLQDTALETKALPRVDLIQQVFYWHYRALCFLEKQKENDQIFPADMQLVGHRIFGASTGLVADINQKLRECYLQILTMIDQDQRPTEFVRVLLFYHFGVDQAPAFHFNSHQESGFSRDVV